MASIWDASTTPASNTSLNSINIAENCPASGLNDAMRELIAETKGAVTGVTASGTDTYTATLAPAPSALTTGMTIHIKFTNANATTTPTLNIGVGGAVTIVKHGSAALAAGDIPAGHEAVLRYNGTNWVLTNPKQATGTVTSVAVAGGSGLTSSGGPITSSGTITLAVGAGTGITVNADDVAVTYATQTDMETPSSIVKSVNPGIVQYHPGVAKSWIRFTISGTTLTVVASNNCSAARNGVGDYTMTFSSAFSSASAYVAVGGCWNASGSGNGTTHESAIAAGSYRVVFQDNAGGNVEATLGQFAFFGDY